jgi:hypothetical protein
MTGACGGVVACSTCHVVVHPSFFSKLPKPDEEELDMLDLAFGLTDWCVLASLCVQYVTRSLRLARAALGLAARSRWTPLWMASSLLCHRKPGMQGADACVVCVYVLRKWLLSASVCPWTARWARCASWAPSMEVRACVPGCHVCAHVCAAAEWVGIEWDDAQRGKHNGSVGGVQYFVSTCVHSPECVCVHE